MGGGLIKERLDRHKSRRRCRRPISAHRLLVGHDIDGFQQQILAAVEAGELHGGETTETAGIYAGIGGYCSLHGQQSAVVFEAQFGVDAQRRRRIGRQQLFAAGQDQADRTADGDRDQGDQRFVEAEFRAKCAADRHTVDGDVGFGHAEHIGDVHAHTEGRLQAAPHGGAAGEGVGLHHPALRFD